MAEEGVWRTISGRRVFIAKGQSLTDAIRKSGKFKSGPFEKKDELTATIIRDNDVSNEDRDYYDSEALKLQNKYELEDSDIEIINDYTNEMYTRIQTDLNTIGYENASDFTRQQIDDFDKALNKLPDRNGTSYSMRKGDFPYSEEDIGKEVIAKGYFSSSYTSDITKQIGGKWGIIFRNTQGKVIEAFSKYPYEKEVIIPRGKTFKIVEINDYVEGLPTVVFEEVKK